MRALSAQRARQAVLGREGAPSSGRTALTTMPGAHAFRAVSVHGRVPRRL